jgi:hypothetical protein
MSNGNQNFTCVGCGACCVGTTSVTVAELFTLADVFPIGISWTRAPAKGEAFRDQFKLLRSFSVSVKSPGSGETVRLHTRLGTMTPVGVPCPARGDDMGCSLHGVGKPGVCSLQPVAVEVPLTAKLDTLIFTQGCPPDAFAGPPILRAGKVVDPDLIRRHAALVAEIQSDRDTMEEALQTLVNARVFAGGWTDDEALDWLIASGGGNLQERYITTQEGCSAAIAAAFLTRKASLQEALRACSGQIATSEAHIRKWADHRRAVEVLKRHIRELGGTVQWLNDPSERGAAAELVANDAG